MLNIVQWWTMSLSRRRRESSGFHIDSVETENFERNKKASISREISLVKKNVIFVSFLRIRISFFHFFPPWMFSLISFTCASSHPRAFFIWFLHVDKSETSRALSDFGMKWIEVIVLFFDISMPITMTSKILLKKKFFNYVISDCRSLPYLNSVVCTIFFPFHSARSIQVKSEIQRRMMIFKDWILCSFSSHISYLYRNFFFHSDFLIV